MAGVRAASTELFWSKIALFWLKITLFWSKITLFGLFLVPVLVQNYFGTGTGTEKGQNRTEMARIIKISCSTAFAWYGTVHLQSFMGRVGWAIKQSTCLISKKII